MVLSTTAAGTISQIARGLSSFFTKSASEEAPIAFSLTSSSTAFGDMSKTTHWWPPLISRRTMLAPIRPSPIIPSCIVLLLILRIEFVRLATVCDQPDLSLSLSFAVAADQVVGRAVVVELGLRLALELRDDALGQHLAQLDAPLVERVDVPDRALGEDAVLVERDQLAERLRRQPFGEDRVRRAVALEDAVRHQPVRRALGLDLLGRLAEGQRLGLGEDVRQQHVVVPAERVERLARRR